MKRLFNTILFLVLIHTLHAQPTFFTNFDEPNQNKIKVFTSGGLLGSKCLDASRGAFVSFKDPELHKALESSKSFTATMWVKYKPDNRKLSRPICLFNLSQSLVFQQHNTYRGRYGVVLPKTKERSTKSAWSGWVSGLVSDNRWMFLAITYDGTQKKDNFRFYVGTQNGEVSLDSKASLDAGSLPKPRELIIGAVSAQGKYPWLGKIDNFRLYNSKKDHTGALSPIKLEQVRRKDLNLKQPYLTDNSTPSSNKLLQKYRELSLKSGNSLHAYHVDYMEKVYPDLAPPVAKLQHHLPRGGFAPIMLSLFSDEGGLVQFKLKDCKNQSGEAFKGKVKSYYTRHVPVEANSNGGIRTQIGVKPPPTWSDYLCREAPFKVADPLIESNQFTLPKDEFHAILFDLQATKNATPGRYQGNIELSFSQKKILVPFSFTIHDVEFSGDYRLHHNLWLLNNPKWITSQNIPNRLWSEEYFKHYLHTAKTLRDFSIDSTLIPHINGRDSLIKVYEEENGTFSFDYTLFDKLISNLNKLGFREYQLTHIPQIFRRPNSVSWHYAGVYKTNLKNGRKELLFPNIKKRKQISKSKFLSLYYKNLQEHLQKKKWVKKIKVGIFDECNKLDQYTKYRNILKSSAPLLASMDANSHYTRFNTLIDSYVFGASAADQYHFLPDDKKSKIKTPWLYHCASPYPPAPNRSLDDPHYGNRVYPWLAHLYGSKGYLIWNANIYRGADPYKSSIGPLPNGKTTPGHPPGDNWLCYPTEKGLAPSMRMLVFREGMLDHTLLSQLSDTDKSSAQKIRSKIVRSLLDHARDNKTYHDARLELLKLLSKNDS